MLLVFSGLPGTGKTTIAKALAAERPTAYVRVDEIEQAVRGWAGPGREVGSVGYLIAFAVASSNLKLGNWVIADSVNPVAESRQGWRDVANDAGKKYLQIEIICSDENEHRRRLESRVTDIAGLVLPTWASVKAREYQPWDSARLVIDTALVSPGDAVTKIGAGIAALR